jgi:acryloyl-coenzyme A reductase
MKAIVAPHVCDADELEFVTVPDPSPASHQVLIRVRASGVCSRDLIARRGGFSATKFPAIMGHEIAGDIVEVGSAVAGFSAGDRVATIQAQPCGYCHECQTGHENVCRNGKGLFGESVPGGYAELVAADTTALVPLHSDVPYETGCILACAVGTALHAVGHRAKITLGDSVLITGASGGVGSHAVQLAKMAGARVIAVTSSASKADAIRAHGADYVIVSEDLNFVTELKGLTDGRGVDVVLEIVGAKSFESSIRCLAPTGRLVFVGNVTAEPVRLSPAVTILKELDLIGSGPCTRAEVVDVMGLVQRGRIRPVIDRVLPLREAGRAHALIEAREVSGRIVLIP